MSSNKTINGIFVSAGHFVALTLMPQNSHHSQKPLMVALCEIFFQNHREIKVK